MSRELAESAVSRPAWVAQARARAWPRREWSDLAGPLASDGHIPEMRTWAAGVGVCVPTLIAPQREAVRLLQKGGGSQDPLVNAVLLTIAPQALGRVVAAAGTQGALQAAALALDLQKNQDHAHPCLYRWTGYRRSAIATRSDQDPSAMWKGLRHALAICSETEYQAALEWAQRQRKEGDLQVRILTAVVLPDQGWAEATAEECLRSGVRRWGILQLPEHSMLLFSSMRDAEATLAFCQACETEPPCDLATTILANLEAAAFAIIWKCLSGPHRAEWIKPLLEIPETEVAEGLRAYLEVRALRGSVVDYYLRHPDLGIPILASAAVSGGKGQDTARTALVQALRHAAEFPSMPPRELAYCQNLQARFRSDLPEACSAELPRVLVAPPWTERKRSQISPPVARVAACPEYPERVEWDGNPGRGYFYDVPPPDGASDKGGMARIEACLKAGTKVPVYHLDSLTDTRALSTWNTLSGRQWEEPWQGLAPLAARFGLDGLPGFLAFAEGHLHAAVTELVRFDTPRVAGVMAQALAGSKSRKLAGAWMRKFPRAALLGLIPSAVGPAGKARAEAEDALRWLATWLPRQDVDEVASVLGVLEAVNWVLDFDPLLLVPRKIPPLPGYLEPESLPRPLLKSGRALPLEAVRHLLTMLAFSPQSPPYAGLAQCKEVCSPDSLEEFAWEVYALWHSAGGPPKEKWAFWALGHLGADECARRLAPLIRSWPQEQLFSRAEMGLDVLAAIGTDVALMNVYQMSQKLKSKALQQRAAAKLEEIAERRGLSSLELADRLVGDLDLDPDGSCRLDFGPRAFLVVFDQQLRPALRDESGKAVKDLPKPSGSDDRELAARALARWKALKKDVKTLAQGQLLRLELAMASRRRWPASDWSQFLLQHPLLVHLVRGLLWGIYSPDGRLLTCFRVAEDSSLAGLDDTPLELDSPGMVGLPHPLELTAEQLASWSDLFSDYQILQPFPQLGRPTYRLTQQELAGTELTRQRGRVVHPGKIANLESRGWRRGETWDGGVCAEMLRPMGEGRWAHLEFRDGLYLGALHESGDQTLDKVVVKQGSQALVLGDLDEILVSELLADLEGVR